MVIRKLLSGLLSLCFMLGSSLSLPAQRSWFVDGYHGGIWGHYPKGYTGFLVEQLQKHPNWKINLEIEPVTWDAVQSDDPAAYASFKKLVAEGTRVEYVNPGFGQSYFYMGSGESMIRQFSYGIKKLRQHFPGISFSAYSSEEPCFTSALPQVLRAFGFKYASLKNPNTCWGGYTRAHGGELVNWIGADGSSVLTVPRYATEELVKNSTWQTTAWNGGKQYVESALAYGIKHPVGMCLQDAGWRNGPWIGPKSDSSAIQYTLWTNYFSTIADPKLATDWKLSQEDIQVSLVWGAQVLQRIAQEVRRAEDKLVATEKLVSLAAVNAGFAWPGIALDLAWENLLLAQHHDCWIVPYNGHNGDTWADKVHNWTEQTTKICDSISELAKKALVLANAENTFLVFNTTALNRQEIISIPAELINSSDFNSIQSGKQFLPVQWSTNYQTGKKELLVKASLPSLGFNSIKLTDQKPFSAKGATALQYNGLVILETDLYRITINPKKGGAITSLIGKEANKEWIKSGSSFFNTVTGNFYNDGGALSTAEQPATVSIVENGPLRVKVRVSTTIAGQPVEQIISISQGEPRIDCELQIDWQKNIGIGNDYKQNKGYKAEDYRKAFYDDSKKLLLNFPVNLNNQKVYKNAPFDVTKSKLDNTLFSTWDSIKNNIILHWVDITEEKDNSGLALFSDHTTAYVHGNDHPLSLVVQYSGVGLWGRNYSVDGPAHIKYSLLPHKGSWDKAALEAERVKLAEPLQISAGEGLGMKQSFIQFSKPGWELSSMIVDGHDLLLRIYNAANTDSSVAVYLPVQLNKATLENLDNSTIKDLAIKKKNQNSVSIPVTAPRFGFRTIRLHNLVKQK